MNNVILILGGNLGDTEKNITDSIAHIEKKIGKIKKRSALYKTAAWGKTDQPDFLNCVIAISTELTAKTVLKNILEIEKIAGRQRTTKYAPRTIDIDILFYNNEVINHYDLIIPHPLLHQRKFVLVPLAEIEPEFVHPVFKKPIMKLNNECRDELNVERFR